MAKVTYTPKDSGHIQHAVYDTDTRSLAVTFHTNGKTYTHMGVPQEAFDNFARFRSPGQFYHTVIRRYRLQEEEKDK